MARALVPHGKVPFPRMGHVFWVPLLLTAVLVPMTRSQTVNIYRPHLTYQSQEGNLKFGVVCRIDWWSQQHNLDRATCSFKLQTLKASGIVDTDETRKLFVVERTSSSTCATRFWLDAAWRGKNLRLQCSWSYTTCAETRDNPQRQKNLPRTQECKNASKKAEITLNPENMRADFTRSAEIQTQMTRPQDGSQPRIDAALGMDLTLFCQVPNLRTLGDRVCEWLFWPQNNAANYSRLHISKRTLNNPSVVSLLGAELLSILSKSDDNNCNLGIRRTELKHQGNWSCDPGSGNDGWIIGSPEVELRLGPCSSDTECWQGGNRQLVCQISPQSRMRNAGAELKSCIRPCDSEKGQKVCQGLPNTVCEYDQSRHDFVRCGCKTPYVSVGTEFSNNNLMRCAKRCKADTECISNEICVLRNATTGSICLPTCEVYPCGQNANCRPHVQSRVFDQRCICNNGTYAINNSGNHVEAKGCMAPHFGGLSMLAISADKGETQACNFTGKIETESCTFSALEGDNITFICSATRIFPEPQLQILGNNYSSLIHLEGAETTSLRSEKGHQETLWSHGSYEEPNPVRGYKIEARLVNAIKVRLENAAFECHFKSKAHQVAIVRVTLTVREEQGVETTSPSEFETPPQEMPGNHSSDREAKAKQIKGNEIEANATKDKLNETPEPHSTSEAQGTQVSVTMSVIREQPESVTTSVPDSVNGPDTSKAVASTQDGMGVIGILLVILAAVLVMATLVSIFVWRKRNNQQLQPSPKNGESHNHASGKGLQEQTASTRCATETTDNVAPGTSSNDGGRQHLLHDRVRYVAPDGQAAAMASVTVSSGDISSDRGNLETKQNMSGGRRHQQDNASASKSKSGRERGGLVEVPASPPQHSGHQHHREHNEKTHEELIYVTLDLDTRGPSSSSSREASSSARQGTKRNARHPPGNPGPRAYNQLLVKEESTYATIVGEMTIVTESDDIN